MRSGLDFDDVQDADEEGDQWGDVFGQQALSAIRREWAVANEVANEEEDVLPLPVVSEEDTNVVIYMSREDPPRRLVRQSILHPGTPRESISFYSYMHQCQICVKPHKVPAANVVRQWIHDGLAIPKSVAGKMRHKRMLKFL